MCLVDISNTLFPLSLFRACVFVLFLFSVLRTSFCFFFWGGELDACFHPRRFSVNVFPLFFVVHAQVKIFVRDLFRFYSFRRECAMYIA